LKTPDIFLQSQAREALFPSEINVLRATRPADRASVRVGEIAGTSRLDGVDEIPNLNQNIIDRRGRACGSLRSRSLRIGHR
jgi:hypothetical protein